MVQRRNFKQNFSKKKSSTPPPPTYLEHPVGSYEWAVMREHEKKREAYLASVSQNEEVVAESQSRGRGRV